jgi:predicted DNA-binding transcriptional regulator YafY
MPQVKTQLFESSAKTRHSLARLEILDQLISKNKGIKTREGLLKMVNSKLADNISVFTLDKDLKDLKDLISSSTDKVELKKTPGAGYYYTKDNYSYFRNSVNDEDRNLLMLAYSVFNIFNGSSLPTKFGSLVNKVLADSLTRERMENLELNKFIQFESRFQYSNKWIITILESIQEQRSIKIEYKKTSEIDEKEKIVCPYFLKQYRNKWYMIAYDCNSTREHKVNVFALESIMDIKLSGKQYYLDPTFNPEHYFQYTLGIWHWHNTDPIIVQLEFNNAYYFNSIQSNPLHLSQKIITAEDENKLVIELEVYNSPELRMLIKSYGNEVKVLAPTALIKEIAESAEKVVVIYKKVDL